MNKSAVLISLLFASVTAQSAALPKALAEKARAAVLAQLKDPYSAKVEGMYLKTGSDMVVCGTVNAKNEYGGYTGKKAFYFANFDGAPAVRMESETFPAWAIEKLCKS